MICQIKRMIMLVCALNLSVLVLLSQYSSKNNYEGAWESSSSWIPTWAVPQTSIGVGITINGYITANESLTFTGIANLIVNDTLVVYGDLTLDNNTSVTINGQGILIVWGNLYINNSASIMVNKYMIVTGNIIKGGSVDQGSFSENSPDKVFIGGSVPSGLTDGNSNYPALNCSSPANPYPYTSCSYGNLSDLQNDPIYPFFESTCQTTTPSITTSGPTAFCAGGSVTLTSSPGNSYMWSTGAATSSIIVTIGGSYSVKVTNANGCQSASSVATIVTVNANPVKPTITAGGATTFCAGDSVTLTSSPGTSYLWSNGATTSDIQVHSTGSYTVQVTNANGCQSVSSGVIAVTVNANPLTPNITASGSTSFCSGGSVTLTSTPGTGYIWSTGATSASIVVNTGGSYSVKVTDINGCQSISSTATIVTVHSIPVTPTITTSGPTAFCSGGNVTLISSPGANYTWSNGAEKDSTVVTQSGNYTVKVTDAYGCQSGSSVATIVTVNPNPAMPSISASGPTTFCAGDSVILTSSLGSTYTWSNGATTKSININSTGNYTVVTTNASGCTSTVSPVSIVTVNALPVVNAGSSSTILHGTNTTMNASITGTGPFTYSWSPSAKLVNSFIEDPTTVNLNQTTVFTLTATSTSTSCSNLSTVTIIVNGGALNSSPVAIPSITCAGAIVQLNALASGGSGIYTYTWTSVPAGFTSSIADPTVNPMINTTYYVAVFDGFNTVNSQVLVTVNPLPTTPTISVSGTTTFCEGGNVTLTSSPGTSYIWSTGETTPSIIVTTGGSYKVTITNADGCQSSISSPIPVAVNAIPVTPNITAEGSTTFCEGDSITLLSSSGSGYLWSNNAGTPGITVTKAGSYTVQVTNAFGCLSDSSVAVILTVNASPVTPIITAGGSTSICAGDSVILTSSTGSSYEWSNGSTTAVIKAITGGNYTVKITNANGCQSAPSAAVTITVNASPLIPTIIPGGLTTFCAGDSVSLNSSIVDSMYVWSTGASTSNIIVKSSGSYTVRVISASGCMSDLSNPVQVTVYPLPVIPTITARGPTSFCEGDSVTLSSSPGTNYFWSNRDTTGSIHIKKAGSYKVMVSNTNGCQSDSSAAILITVNALPPIPTIEPGGQISICSGDSVSLTSSTGFNYLWLTGAATPSINVNTSGSYSVSIYNTNGCKSMASVPTVVTVNALPFVNITSSDSSMCTDATRTLNGVPAGGTFIISSGPGSINGNVLSATGTGTINLVYNYTNICSNQMAQSIIVNAIPVANAGSDQDLTFVFETAMNASLTGTETGTWSLISGDGNIVDIHSPITSVTHLSLGENIFSWQVQNGPCTANELVKITVHDLFVPSVITPNGDGKNDYFTIAENIGQVGLIIIDKWGNEVYTSDNYVNDWNGQNNQGMALPNDTYFYILKFVNGRVKKGFVLIKR